MDNFSSEIVPWRSFKRDIKTVITLTKHSGIEASSKETCTEEYRECEVYGKLFVDEDAEEEIEKPVIIPLKEHTLEYKRMELPTYDKEGLSEGRFPVPVVSGPSGG